MNEGDTTKNADGNSTVNIPEDREVHEDLRTGGDSDGPIGSKTAEAEKKTDSMEIQPHTKEELTFMQQLEQREKAFQQEKMKFETERLLAKYGIPVDDKILKHVMKADVEETESYIAELHGIIAECTKQELAKKLVGKTPISSSGSFSSLGTSYSNNLRDQVKNALK